MRAVVLMAALAVLAGACGDGAGDIGTRGSPRSRLRGARGSPLRGARASELPPQVGARLRGARARRRPLAGKR